MPCVSWPLKSYLYLSVNFKITAITLDVGSGCPPVRADLVIAIAVWEQHCRSKFRGLSDRDIISEGKNKLKLYNVICMAIAICINSDQCQACVFCIDGVRISESPLWDMHL